MDPITIYKLSKVQQEEIEAEYKRYWSLHLDQVSEPKRSLSQRLLFGLGSLILGLVIIAQTFI